MRLYETFKGYGVEIVADDQHTQGMFTDERIDI